MAKPDLRFHHPALGSINGRSNGDLKQFLNIPYGKISQRFGRAILVDKLPQTDQQQPYDATNIPPASIQPWGSGKMDCEGNQFPFDLMDGYEENQAEDCLKLNITMPKSTKPNDSLPVLVFVHGGAFFIGSSSRPYYDPVTLCAEAMKTECPHIFVSINYRLGGLGFFHSPGASDLMPPNNGLHDQRIAFDWIERFIGGFGGDADNITAMGQSAGGMSVTTHNLSGKRNVWKRSIQFSGSLVTMPVKSPKEHQENFVNQAKKLGLDTERSCEQIAKDMIELPVNQIRDCGYVGLPCTSTELLPYSNASMAHMSRTSSLPPTSPPTQLLSSTTYDGGISHNLLLPNSNRKSHASTFTTIAKSTLSPTHAQALLDLYALRPTDNDATALRKICQFESDIGFFAASVAQASGFAGKSYLLLFDLPNPFDGLLPPGECATHTWDILALLGACEERLGEGYRGVIGDLRRRVLRYVACGEEPWDQWTEGEGRVCVVGKEGVRVVGWEEVMGKETRRGKLLALAERVGGVDGPDLLWDGLCRRFLMGNE